MSPWLTNGEQPTDITLFIFINSEMIVYVGQKSQKRLNIWLYSISEERLLLLYCQKAYVWPIKAQRSVFNVSLIFLKLTVRHKMLQNEFFFIFWFYSPFINISLISRQSFVQSGWRLVYPKKNYPLITTKTWYLGLLQFHYTSTEFETSAEAIICKIIMYLILKSLLFWIFVCEVYKL